MKSLGISFPTLAEAALQNAAEYRGLSASERLDRLLALLRTVEEICAGRPDRAEQAAAYDRRKDEELQALIGVQIRGHV